LEGAIIALCGIGVKSSNGMLENGKAEEIWGNCKQKIEKTHPFIGL
jgi:hypothetical protein